MSTPAQAPSFDSLPETAADFKRWEWSRIEPYFQDLKSRQLDPASQVAWLADWSRVRALVEEGRARLLVARRQNTADEAAAQAFQDYQASVYRRAEAADQELKLKLLDSGLEPEAFDIQLRNFRAEAEIFREANLPLLTEHERLAGEYDRVVGAQTARWEGQERTLTQLNPLLRHPDRGVRERVWKLMAERWLQDRAAINDIWVQLLQLRQQIAANADLAEARSYYWVKRMRFDYTPQDCKAFHAAIEEVAVPAAGRIYERKRAVLGVESLRPWDTAVDPRGCPPLKPFEDPAELEATAADIFRQVDPTLGAYFEQMRQAQLLDLENRKGKGPGAFCMTFSAARIPFIFMNAVGLHSDVQTLLHESGHAFHAFESRELNYFQRDSKPPEFAEVASMAMELLAAPYLDRDRGGFYTSEEVARARSEHLEKILLFWPYMAVVDAFQHWVYENLGAAMEPAACDGKWSELWERYMIGEDWSGFRDFKETGWHRKLHMYHFPFYYIEYGLAQLGAVQIWAKALRDRPRALADYRRALAKGATLSLPRLYEAAGARLAFDADALREAVDLIEATLEELNAG